MNTTLNLSLISNDSLDIYIKTRDGREVDEDNNFDIKSLNFTWNVTYFKDNKLKL